VTVGPVLIVVAVAATVWFACLLAVSVRRRAALAWILTALALFSVSNAAVVARLVLPGDAPWDAVWIVSFLLSHAAVAAFAITYLPSGRSRLRDLGSAGITLLGVGLAVAGVAAGWRIADAFRPATTAGLYSLAAFPIACLAVALGESLAAMRHASHRRHEAWLLLLGTLVLLVGGPVYAVELAVLGHVDFAGTNLAVPVAAVLFGQALLAANPLPFRGRAAPTARIPWDLPPGVYVLDEVRPTYAEATFLALAGTQPALAIVGSGPPRRGLEGVETVCLPPGPRCASVLAATAKEFLARHPRGTVLVHDASYVVTQGGPGALAAIRSVLLAMPEGASLVVSLAMLTPSERQAFRTVLATWGSPPELHAAVAAILRARLGSADLLRRAVREWDIRPQDLGVADVPPLLEYVQNALQGLRTASDGAAEPGWSQVSKSLAGDLVEFWRTPPTQPTLRTLATPAATLGALGLVKASSISGLDAPPPEERVGAPMGEEIRDAFLAHLGPAGAPVWRRVLRTLQKDASAIGKEDLANVARLANEAIADLGGAVDVADAGRDLAHRSRRLQAQLAGFGGEGR